MFAPHRGRSAGRSVKENGKEARFAETEGLMSGRESLGVAGPEATHLTLEALAT